MTTPLLLPAKIKELRKALPDHPHRNYTRTDDPDTVGANWVSMLRPYLWEHLETKHVGPGGTTSGPEGRHRARRDDIGPGGTTSYSAYQDLGYGNIALFKHDTLIGVTDRPILAIKGHPILLDKEYYGIDKYIWR